MGWSGTLVIAWIDLSAVLRRPVRSAIGRCCSFGILLVFTGVQLVTVGLLAELQARTYHESQDKPTYVIREVRETADTPSMRHVI